MQSDQIRAYQTRVGALADGDWGTKSKAACQAYLRGLMPVPHPFPATDETSLREFYGAAGDESKLTNLDVSGLGLKYDGAPVKTVRCHGKIAAPLLRVFQAIAASPFSYVLKNYAGCYNFRAMRGGSSWSLHARGAAVDLDPDTNGNNMHWPDQCTMPLEVMEMFAREGFLAAGAFWGRDSMHFQGTR